MVLWRIVILVSIVLASNVSGAQPSLQVSLKETGVVFGRMGFVSELRLVCLWVCGTPFEGSYGHYGAGVDIVWPQTPTEWGGCSEHRGSSTQLTVTRRNFRQNSHRLHPHWRGPPNAPKNSSSPTCSRVNIDRYYQL